MKKLTILCVICLMGVSAMAQVDIKTEIQEVNAVKFVQGETTDWYLLADELVVTFTDDHKLTIAGKTYDLANGNIETTFGVAPQNPTNMEQLFQPSSPSGDETAEAIKYIRGGQFYIVSDDRTYNAQGAIVR